MALPSGSGPMRMDHRRRAFGRSCGRRDERDRSSSFIAMRENVSRISRAAATGSGLPFGPSGFT